MGDVGGLAAVGLAAKVPSSEMRLGLSRSSLRPSTTASSSKVTRFRATGARLPERVFTSARLIRLEYRSRMMDVVTVVEEEGEGEDLSLSVTAPWLDNAFSGEVFSMRRF